MSKTVFVVGAGTMGVGIAQVCAMQAHMVLLMDISTVSLEKATQQMSQGLDRFIKKGTIAAQDKAAILERVRTTTQISDAQNADVVIEAATENHASKKKIIQELSTVISTHTIVATNTSSLSITELASSVPCADRFIGLHFFNPVPVMPLVEIIRGLQTSDATNQLAQQFVTTLNKTAICVKNSCGFVVNRVLIPMINEAVFVYAEGVATPQDIDAAMKMGCNHPIGPLALADMVGLDVCLAVMDTFYREFSDPKYRPCPLLKEMVAAGYLGQKTKRGFFQYA